MSPQGGEALRREMGIGRRAAQIWGLCGWSLGELLILQGSGAIALGPECPSTGSPFHSRWPLVNLLRALGSEGVIRTPRVHLRLHP